MSWTLSYNNECFPTSLQEALIILLWKPGKLNVCDNYVPNKSDKYWCKNSS